MKVNGIQMNSLDPIDFHCMDKKQNIFQNSSFCVL